MVHHIHSPAERDTENRFRNWRNSIIENFSLARARKLIAVSASLERALLAKGVRPDRLRLVPNGVPVRPKSEIRYLPGSRLIVGMMALFRPRKGIEILMEAMALLKNEGLNLSLRAVGPFETPEYQREIEILAQKMGLADDIVWTGFKPDVEAELRKMQLFVLPSLYGEGMPMVLLEAMSVGLPIVATRVEGIPEVVRDGREGLLVDAGSARSTANAIRQIAAGVYNAAVLGENGWNRQRAVFSDSKMAEGVASVYREVLQ
jgi:glycosyltransferase involved in cell wall biosynthesis